MSEVKRIRHIDMEKYLPIVRDRFLEMAGSAVTAQAKMLAPVDTGLLRGSINWRVADGSGSAIEAPASGENDLTAAERNTVKIGTNVEYAEHMEYGTLRLPTGKPYLRPAARMLKTKLRAMLLKLIKEAETSAK